MWVRGVQIGQDRGGMYGYDWLENLFGLRIHTANSHFTSGRHRFNCGASG
jgi:hypothetical protein